MTDINTWPGWECVKELGEGSFGKVYEIQRVEREKIYKAALKVITIPFSQSDIRDAFSEGMSEQNVTEYFQEFVETIAEEFALMSEFKGQSNIVSYEDHMVLKHEDDIGWDILIRMELLTSLQEWSREHPLKEVDVIALGCDICHALELCWQKRIIHRDIKPENIFVNEYGDYKLGDFGIARTVEKTMATLSQKGTYTYIAPEVYKGQEYGQTADIYSLGLVLYRFLNENKVPFLPMGATLRYNDRDEAFKRRICGEQIHPPVHGSQALKEVILKSIAYMPEERYESAAQFRKALEKCVKEVGENSEGTLRLFSQKAVNVPEQPQRQTQVMKAAPVESQQTVHKNTKKQIFIVCLSGMIGLIFVLGVMLASIREKDIETGKNGDDSLKTELLETEEFSQENESLSIESVADETEQTTSEQEEDEDKVIVEETSTFGFTAEPYTCGKTSVLLVGDTTELWMSDGSFVLFNDSAGVSWSSSNDAIAKVSSHGIVTAVSPGMVDITGIYKGEKSESWQMTIVQEDKNSGVTVSADYERISLGVNASETVMLTLHGTVVDRIGAVCYASSGLDLRFDWGGVIDGNTIPLNFENMFTTSADEGDITVLFYREDEPEKIIAKTMIHVKVN